MVRSILRPLKSQTLGTRIYLLKNATSNMQRLLHDRVITMRKILKVCCVLSITRYSHAVRQYIRFVLQHRELIKFETMLLVEWQWKRCPKSRLPRLMYKSCRGLRRLGKQYSYRKPRCLGKLLSSRPRYISLNGADHFVLPSLLLTDKRLLHEYS